MLKFKDSQRCVSLSESIHGGVFIEKCPFMLVNLLHTISSIYVAISSCVKTFLVCAKEFFLAFPVDIITSRKMTGQIFKFPVRIIRSRKISGRGYKLFPTLLMSFVRAVPCY